MAAIVPTILLLVLSNVFMTFAWYGHLGGDNRPTWSALEFVADLKNRPWLLAVMVSWGIAFIEYLFQVPANRLGSESMTKAQLKILQEVIALAVFAALAAFYWREAVTWNYLWAGLCIMAAVFFIFRDGPTAADRAAPPAALPPVAVDAELPKGGKDSECV
jgi:uncharacterized protein (DUF486 family)